MKKGACLLAAWLFVAAASAQEFDIWTKTINNDTNGVWHVQPDKPKSKDVKAPGIPGEMALRVKGRQGANPWDVQASSPIGGGIATGYATLGRVGFESRYEYGAIGNAVILAQRLSDVAAPGEILVSQRTHAAVEPEYPTEAMPELQLKGFTRPVVAMRVIGDRD